MTTIKKTILPEDEPELQWSQVNQSLQQIDNQFRTHIVKDRTGNDRVLVGYQADGFGDGEDYGIKVSQSGIDVKTAADEELVMSSQFNMFKIVEVIEKTITVPDPSTAGTHVLQLDHDYGVAPMMMCWIKAPINSSYQLVPYFFGFPAVPIWAKCWVNSNYFWLSVYISSDLAGAAGHGDWEFKIYVIEETLGT